MGWETMQKLELRSVSRDFGAVRAVDSVSFGLQAGQMLALLGPSGCGKTTTLRMIAGLERPTSGEIVLDEQVLASASNSVLPEHRGLGMVFQTYALWPHMTVFENVAYGLRKFRMAESELRSRVDQVLRMAGMSGYEERPSTNLSGGQQQRVAVARALATRPKVLLFDEPLSNLDAMLRESMRLEIRSLQKENGITSIYVTHSQEEALAMADVVGVMKDGQLQQMASPEEIYARPKNRFVAGFVGLANILTARVEAVSGLRMRVMLENGRRGECERHSNQAKEFRPGDPVSLALRPGRIQIRKIVDKAAGTGRNGEFSLAGVVTSVVFTGILIDYFVQVDGLSEQIRVQTLSPAVAGQGEQVSLSISPENSIVLDD